MPRTVIVMFPEIVGVPPGLETRRACSVPKVAPSTPMNQPSVDDGFGLSTPRGANGPMKSGCDISRRNTVTTIGPEPSTEDLRMTQPSVASKVPPQKLSVPM